MGYRQAIVLLITGLAAGADRECDLVLQRTAAKVVASYRSITSYACLETVEREYYRPRGATLPRECPVLMEQRTHPTPDLVLFLSSRDRLRLEVTTSSKGEIQSWPGASKFVESGIENLVREGPIGTGAFGTLLSVMFATDVKKFGFVGEDVIAGRRRLIYTFQVPVSDSHYRVKSMDNHDWLTVGYEGVLYVDATSADPARVTVSTNELPLAAGVCQTTSTLQFHRDANVGEELLLPQKAVQRFVSPNGNETQNTTTFSDCRQYSSQSSISFYTSADDTAGTIHAAARPHAAVIPEGLPFSMELLEAIDGDTAAAGDRFRARLATPLRDGRRTIAPKGALIEGRVSEVEVGYHPTEMVAIGLIPESLEVQGVKVSFAARLDLSVGVVAKEQRIRKGLQFFLPAPGEVPHEFRLPGTHNILKKGFTTDWQTAAVRSQRFN